MDSSKIKTFLWGETDSTQGTVTVSNNEKNVQKTWQVPISLDHRLNKFVLDKCPPNTTVVKVIRQILHHFLDERGY